MDSLIDQLTMTNTCVCVDSFTAWLSNVTLPLMPYNHHYITVHKSTCSIGNGTNSSCIPAFHALLPV